MIFIVFLINSILLAITLANFLSIRRPAAIAEISESIAVLLPVRNEEANIERVLLELDRQVGLSDYRIILINDASEDRTEEIARQIKSDRIEIIEAPALPAGWIGKVSALQTGFAAIADRDFDFVISIDADVSFAPDAIARAIGTLNKAKLDFISPYPRQIAVTWSERLSQPLLQWSWMSTVLLRGAERIPLTSTVICNGQFLVMRASSLNAIGGFESVAHKVLDDIELGRSFVRNGYRGAVMDGSELASTRMYSSLHEVRAGYGKSLHTAFGSLGGAIFASLFIFFTGIYPLLQSLNGNLLALAALCAIIGTRLLSAIAASTRIRDALLHPASSALFIYLLYYSWRNRRTAQWKGRTL